MAIATLLLTDLRFYLTTSQLSQPGFPLELYIEKEVTDLLSVPPFPPDLLAEEEEVDKMMEQKMKEEEERKRTKEMEERMSLEETKEQVRKFVICYSL